MEAIGQSLPALLKRHAQKAKPELAQILAPWWGRVAGKVVAEHSRPVAFWLGTLTIATPCSTWATQLRLLGEEIIEAVNKFLGAPVVRQLRIRLVRDLPGVESSGRIANPEAAPGGGLRSSNLEFAGALDGETARVVERSFSKYFSRRGPEPD